MAPPSGTTATTAGPAPVPQFPRDTWGRPSRSARSGGWRGPQCRSGRRFSSPGRPPPTPSRRPRSPCRPRRPPLPLRPRPLPPRPRRRPQVHKELRLRRRHVAGAGDRARAGPERLAESRRSRSGAKGGRHSTVPTPSPATPTPAPPSRTRPRPPSPRGGRGPLAPRRLRVRRRASHCRSCSGSKTPGA